MSKEYWDEAVAIALEDAGLKATQEQIEQIAGSIEISHECYGMAHGYDCIPNAREERIKELEQKLKRESDKRVCKSCWGSGRITTYGGTFESNSPCDDCRGDGYIYPR